jgi:hypothetical protein
VLISELGDLTITVPQDAVSECVTLELTSLDQPNHPYGAVLADVGASVAEMVYAGHAFTLSATDQQGDPFTTFALPLEVEVRYLDRDWETAGVVERSLRLYAWNGGRWVKEWPCTDCVLRWDENRLVVHVDHLGDFALFGSPSWWEYYLPLDFRNRSPQFLAGVEALARAMP